MKYQVEFTALRKGTTLTFDNIEEASDYALKTIRASKGNMFSIKKVFIRFIYEEDNPDGTICEDIQENENVGLV